MSVGVGWYHCIGKPGIPRYGESIVSESLASVVYYRAPVDGE